MYALVQCEEQKFRHFNDALTFRKLHAMQSLPKYSRFAIT